MAAKKEKKTTVLQMNKKKGNASKRPQTTLENPFSVKLPEITQDLQNEIKLQLELCCLNLSMPSLIPPWKKVSKLKGEERTHYRQQYKRDELEKLLGDPESASKLEIAKEARSYLIFGYNAVMRALEQDKLAGILLKKDTTPMFLGETFVPGCVSRDIPLVALGGLDDILKRQDMLGVKHSIMVLGLKSSVKESTSRFFPLYCCMQKTVNNIGETHLMENFVTTGTCDDKENVSYKEKKAKSPLPMDISSEKNASKEDKANYPLPTEISIEEKTSEEGKAKRPLSVEMSSTVNIFKGNQEERLSLMDVSSEGNIPMENKTEVSFQHISKENQAEHSIPMVISPEKNASLDTKSKSSLSTEIPFEKNIDKENKVELPIPMDISTENKVSCTLSTEISLEQNITKAKMAENLLPIDISNVEDISSENKIKNSLPIKISAEDIIKQNITDGPEDVISINDNYHTVEKKTVENSRSKLNSNEGTISKYKLTAEEIDSYHLKRSDRSKRVFIPETKKIKCVVVEEEDVIRFGPSELRGSPRKNKALENSLRPQVKSKVNKEHLEKPKPVGFKFDFNIDRVEAESTMVTEHFPVTSKRDDEVVSFIQGKGVQERKEKTHDFNFEFFLDTTGDQKVETKESLISDSKKGSMVNPAEDMVAPELTNTRVSEGMSEMESSISKTAATGQVKETRVNVEGKENHLQFFIDTEGELNVNTPEEGGSRNETSKRKFIDNVDNRVKKKKKNTVSFPYAPAQLRRVKSNPNRKSNK